jgi:hypothetical protein
VQARLRPALAVFAALLVALVPAAASAAAQAPAGDPLTGTGMWIWHVAGSDGGTPPAIAARARSAAVRTVVIKAAHGPAYWPQFSPPLIAGLKAAGLRVCAYQRVLGRRPAAEAATAARVVRMGADCFVIDAEIELEGRYAQARAYMTALRGAVGPGYPIAFTGFPYVDLHPRFPYSVFLGPGGAQFNVPQIYWKALDAPVATAFARTYSHNRIYGRPIRPLGQLWNGPARAQVLSFRRLAQGYGAAGLSWWNWEQTRAADWATISAPVGAVAPVDTTAAYPVLRRGMRGDMVLWAKQQMVRLGRPATPGTLFDGDLERTVRDLQLIQGLAPTGVLDATTWPGLLPAAE